MIRSSRDNGGWRAQRENDRRKERGIWAGHSKRIVGPPDSGSAHRRIAGLYRVPTLDPSRSLRRPRISFPPPLPHPRICLLAPGKNSVAPKRTFSSLVSAGWRAQRENDRRKERGIWGGALEENRGPHLTAVLLTDGSQVCIVYRRSTRAIPCAALAFPSLRRFLTLASACWPQGKIPPHPSARSAHSSPQDGGPKGKMIEEIGRP